MKRRQFITLGVLSTLATIFVLGCRPKTTTISKVIVNQAFEHPLYIGLYVAQDAGFFKAEGLDVEIKTGGGDSQAFSALTSGAAQFAQGDPAFVALANEQGYQSRVIAMAVDRVAIWGVTFDNKIKPFVDPIGFKGKTITTYPEPNTSYVVQKQLSIQAGLKIGTDTKILQVPFGSELATLKDGRANVAQTIEPNVSQVVKEGGTVVFSYPDAYGPLAFTGVMVSKDFIDKNPETVQKFINAYEKALRYVHSNFEETVKIAQAKIPTVAPDIMKEALSRLIDSDSIPRTAKVDLKSWQKLLKIRIEVKDLKEMPKIDLIDNSFAEKALQDK
ncbi:MAG: ABC transporter substrate-binding protein [Symploca sp. SIO1C4]|uniref:ABC transporter substrate-binding protein n=1 Tax=Symploca sp. SIO1C4 TaxID=2607765 RepID=A0A6B3N6L4_9CYAN|nr:ABC transporter substrate-binding protein [Symploca sp. SIO1C4]